jgi:hypothetical protein
VASVVNGSGASENMPTHQLCVSTAHSNKVRPQSTLGALHCCCTGKKVGSGVFYLGKVR